MNKSDLVREIAARTGASMRQSRLILDAALGAIADALSSGKEVRLVGFGVFSVRSGAGRMGRNPATMEPVQIPPRRVPAFRASRRLRNRVAAGESEEA